MSRSVGPIVTILPDTSAREPDLVWPVCRLSWSPYGGFVNRNCVLCRCCVQRVVLIIRDYPLGNTCDRLKFPVVIPVEYEQQEACMELTYSTILVVVWGIYLNARIGGGLNKLKII